MDETKLTIYSIDTDREMPLQYAADGVHAGFPSPAQGHDKRWHMKSEYRSQRYTTNLREVIRVKTT